MLNPDYNGDKKAGSSTIPGVDAFKLYQTPMVFPLEQTQEMASEQGLTVDVDTAFKEAMEDQRKRAGSARQEG